MQDITKVPLVAIGHRKMSQSATFYPCTMATSGSTGWLASIKRLGLILNRCISVRRGLGGREGAGDRGLGLVHGSMEWPVSITGLVDTWVFEGGWDGGMDML